jgi:hypothetical protein
MQYRYAKFIATRYLQSAGERNVTKGNKFKSYSFGNIGKAKAVFF